MAKPPCNVRLRSEEVGDTVTWRVEPLFFISENNCTSKIFIKAEGEPERQVTGTGGDPRVDAKGDNFITLKPKPDKNVSVRFEIDCPGCESKPSDSYWRPAQGASWITKLVKHIGAALGLIVLPPFFGLMMLAWLLAFPFAVWGGLQPWLNVGDKWLQDFLKTMQKLCDTLTKW